MQCEFKIKSKFHEQQLLNLISLLPQRHSGEMTQCYGTGASVPGKEKLSGLQVCSWGRNHYPMRARQREEKSRAGGFDLTEKKTRYINTELDLN